MKGQYANIVNLIIGLVVIFGMMTAISPKGPDGIPILLGKSNLMVMLGFCTFNILLGTGMTFAIVTGGIDLSVGRCLALSNVLFALVLNATSSLCLAALSAVLAGAAVGLTNGIITVKGRIPSFIATLGMYMVCWGLAYVISGGETITTRAEVMDRSLVRALLPLAPVIVPIMAVAAAHALLSSFKFGRFVYAVGGNLEAARLSGIAVDRVRILAFVICGCCAGIGGIIYWAKLGTGSSLAGEAFELYAIAAVIIGGTSLSGGEGTVIGAFIGALIMGVLREGLVIRQVSEHWQKVVFGTVIIGAVLFDSLRRRRRE
jgi:ribose transport system permease protein